MASRHRYEIGIVGGSGLYELDGAKPIETINKPKTPYGSASDDIFGVEIEGIPVAFLARHGRGHALTPSEVPYRANVFALKSLGVKKVLAISAVGSLRIGLRPEDFVLPDQLIDRTFLRPQSFFGAGLVGHVSFADPFCQKLKNALQGSFLKQEQQNGVRVVGSGTYVCIEGPAFSTRAESNLYRAWGADLIGMTALPEAKLAREAELCYALLGMVTDYDSWKQNEEAVSAEGALAHMSRNLKELKKHLGRMVLAMAGAPDCDHENNMQQAIVTSKKHIPEATKTQLKALYGKYF